MKTRQQAAEEYGLNKYGEYFEESVKKEVIQDFLAGCEHVDNSRWIPVIERLPDIQDGGFVECLVWKSWGMNSALNLARYNPKVKAFLNHNFNHIDGVTHWMPLPEPPQPFKD